jgi:hypothetical protein
MIYAIECEPTDSGPTIRDGRLEQYIHRFSSQEEFQRRSDQLWSHGKNLVQVQDGNKGAFWYHQQQILCSDDE